MVSFGEDKIENHSSDGSKTYAAEFYPAKIKTHSADGEDRCQVMMAGLNALVMVPAIPHLPTP